LLGLVLPLVVQGRGRGRTAALAARRSRTVHYYVVAIYSSQQTSGRVLYCMLASVVSLAPVRSSR